VGKIGRPKLGRIFLGGFFFWGSIIFRVKVFYLFIPNDICDYNVSNAHLII
jgi:hypothetical protein